MSKMHCFTIALSCLLARALHAQPDGFYLIEGEASAPFVDEDGCYTVKVGKSATIGWNSFLVEKGETFRFEQEDSESTVINFVTGQSQSTLSGNIQSKGKIYLNHPSKIVVTPDAVLNAPQIVLLPRSCCLRLAGSRFGGSPAQFRRSHPPDWAYVDHRLPRERQASRPDPQQGASLDGQGCPTGVRRAARGLRRGCASAAQVVRGRIRPRPPPRGGTARGRAR